VLRGKINWFKQLNNNKAEKLSAALTEALTLHKVEIQEQAPQTISDEVSGLEMNSNVGTLPWEEEIQQATSIQAPQAT
jgi:hypothetical protein